MIKLGIIGCGRIAGAHINAIRSLKGKFDVVSLFDVNADKAEEFSKKTGIKVIHNLDELLSDNSIDLVSITVPDGFHYEMAKKALLAHKNVLLEKPIALNINEINDLLGFSSKEKLFLGVVLQKRLFKAFKEVKRMIRNEEIGHLFLTSFQQIWYRDEHYFENSWHGNKKIDGGLILNQSAHNIDLIDWISGPIGKVFAYGGAIVKKNIETEDTVSSVFKTKRGIGNITLTISSYPSNYGELFEFIGDKGKIAIGTGAFEHLTSEKLLTYMPELKRPTLSGYGHRLVYDEVYKALSGENIDSVSIKNTYHSFLVGLGIRKSLEENKEVIIGGKNEH